MMPKPLLTLTAADLMSQPALVLPEGMSLQGAARMLWQAQVSGAPVVDPEGRCVGVLSGTDFIHVMEQDTHGGRCGCGLDQFNFPWQLADYATFPPDSVHEHMTADPVLVARETPLGELAQCMLDAHIHRLVVVDERQRPLGIVSATDILAAVALTARLRPASCRPEAELASG